MIDKYVCTVLCDFRCMFACTVNIVDEDKEIRTCHIGDFYISGTTEIAVML